MKALATLALGLFASSQVWAVCPAGTEASTEMVQGKSICYLGQKPANDADIPVSIYGKTDLVLSAEHAWILRGDVRIGGDQKDNSTLTLEAGATVYGMPGSFLTITRDSKIFVNGSATNPVVMSALTAERGKWGGLVIAGNAKINNCTQVGPKGYCESFIEGADPAKAPLYGGLNDDDSSGVIRYLRVEYAGFTFGKDSELNGITFYGVGRGTTVEYIQSYMGADDGVELFGGTVNMKYVVSTDNDDDGFDWDQGWTGAVQYLYITVENASEKDPNGIEADNFKDNHTATPRSNPILSNVTVVAKAGNPQILNGVQLRRGTGAQFYNMIVRGGFQNCLNIDDAETFSNGGQVSGGVVTQTGLVMQNALLQCNNNQILEDAATDPWSITQWFTGDVNLNNYVVAPSEKVVDASGIIPVEGSMALDTGMTPPDGALPGGFQFDSVDYVGAFSPVEADWTAGWTK